jgi:hypothetical protein
MSRQHEQRSGATERQSEPADSDAKNSKVKSLEDVAAKYGLAPADEVAGSRSGRAYLDFGRPILMADSTSSSRQTEADRELWSHALSAFES